MANRLVAEWRLRSGRVIAKLLRDNAGAAWTYSADNAGGVFYGSRADALQWAGKRASAEGFSSARLELAPGLDPESAECISTMRGTLRAILTEARGIEKDARADWFHAQGLPAPDRLPDRGPVESAAEILDLAIAYRERLEGMIRPVLGEPEGSAVHAHSPDGSGAFYDACACGAVRRAASAGADPGPWHACELCAPGGGS